VLHEPILFDEPVCGSVSASLQAAPTAGYFNNGDEYRQSYVVACFKDVTTRIMAAHFPPEPFNVEKISLISTYK
jgi:hypothetical protein